ncbi:hypothetical protein PORY_000715 [Pneumocystis oryctolagi]|uniref:Uncharacterized protein n=1 Tax=Pneumocystis oryctolagi TaxID=42067 RepID=A0ACB7CEK8_9ASCO|nr:hypothetical protein PORY_000715 [Pneumocystis oryctolagi]
MEYSTYELNVVTMERMSKRYSAVTLYLSMASQENENVDDELSQAQKYLRQLKLRISEQSKKNFVLERDVRYLDSRIALLIQNRMALNEQNEMTNQFDDSSELQKGIFPDDRKLQQYGNLFFLLQTEPRHIATLCRLVSLSEIDALLQTVMFTIYGNQYESREEHLLLTMFQSVLSSEFDSATEFVSLLRANTPISRMMTTYTRRGPGQSYLKAVLSERINYLYEHNEFDLEINSLKVYDQMIQKIEADTGCLPNNLERSVTYETAAANDAVIAIIKPRIAMLMEIADSFLSVIIDSIDIVPYGIRWICKQIRSFTKRKYPDSSDYSICSLIGGFFFLRFINPAIVTPHAYMLIDGSPGEYLRRTLTLIAKMLQNLANKPSYSKEPYMTSLSSFIDSNKLRVNKFLNDLCEVGDFYETLEMDQYVVLSKKGLSLHITVNEMYSTHSLLEKHLDILAPELDSHLRILINKLGPAPALLSRPENRTIELPLYSKWENSITTLNESLDISQADILFMEAKTIFVQIIRSFPQGSKAIKQPLNLLLIASTAATSKDALLVRKGIKAIEYLKELSELKLIDPNDFYNPLAEEVEQEIAHLGSLYEKVMHEIESLESVYKTIEDHNEYLRSQLEQYKSYLHNVRIQSGGRNEGKIDGVMGGVGVVSVGGKERKQKKQQVLGPYKYTHFQLEKESVIAESNVPDDRRANIYFTITSPLPGTFVISLYYKGRDRGLLELDLKLDDLLEMQKSNVQYLDLEYVQFNVSKILQLVNRQFSRKKKNGDNFRLNIGFLHFDFFFRIDAMADVFHCVYCFHVLIDYFDKKRSVIQKLSKRDDNIISRIQNIKSFLHDEVLFPLFVTWNIISSSGHKSLRGCIGTFKPLPLKHGLHSYALTSALNDSRFPPISEEEVPFLECSVTLLTNFETIEDPLDWIIGLHGLQISFVYKNKHMSATYLPCVAEEQNWTKEETLSNLLIKAGVNERVFNWRQINMKVTRYQGSKAECTYDEYVKIVSSIN